MAQPLASPYSYFADSNGAPLAGGKIYTYVAGTTTPQPTYTDSTLITPLANPVVLDSAGRAQIWLSGFYKIVVKDALGNTISTTDNISAVSNGGDMLASTYDPANISEQLVGINAAQTLANKTLETPDITGVTNGGNASTGSLGELISSTVATGSAVSLVTSTAKTVTSISLTAGDWDVWGNVGFIPAASTSITNLTSTISSAANTLPGSPNSGAYFTLPMNATVSGGSGFVLPTGMLRISIASTKTIYLIGQATFTVSTLTAYGFIGARRVR